MSQDKAPSYALWVELCTRIATRRLHYRAGEEETAAESIHKLFAKTRTVMEQHQEAEEFQKLALKLLNDTLRPYTSRWHGWMTADKELRDANGRPVLKFLDEWVRRQFRRELQELQPRLIGFKKAFEALIDETLPEDWWTSPNEVQLKHLRRECSFAAEADLGKSLEPGIGDQVRFGKIKMEDQEKLVDQINDVERGEIRKRRKLLGMAEADNVNAKAVAFSGGGIRPRPFA
jgi:hypothetical protein